MSVTWVNRQRHTNHLARKIANYLFQQDEITPNQLHGLSKLSWITTNYWGEDAGYIRSTKIPALEAIFEYKVKMAIHKVFPIRRGRIKNRYSPAFSNKGREGKEFYLHNIYFSFVIP